MIYILIEKVREHGECLARVQIFFTVSCVMAHDIKHTRRYISKAEKKFHCLQNSMARKPNISILS